jgi:hypothetical protein
LFAVIVAAVSIYRMQFCVSISVMAAFQNHDYIFCATLDYHRFGNWVISSVTSGFLTNKVVIIKLR